MPDRCSKPWLSSSWRVHRSNRVNHCQLPQFKAPQLDPQCDLILDGTSERRTKKTKIEQQYLSWICEAASEVHCTDNFSKHCHD